MSPRYFGKHGEAIEALRKIYGESTPPPDVTEMDIGMYLCNYNIAKGKELEK